MGVCQLRNKSMWKKEKTYNNYVEAFKELLFLKANYYDFKHAYHLFVMVLIKIKRKKQK